MFKKRLLAKVPVPKTTPHTVVYGCVDCRMPEAHMELIGNQLQFEHGEYFQNTTPGSLNDLTSPVTAVRANALAAVKLFLDKGVNQFILTAHTQCAADALIHNFRPVDGNPDEREESFQFAKLDEGSKQILSVSRSKGISVEFRYYLLDILGELIEISELDREQAAGA